MCLSTGTSRPGMQQEMQSQSAEYPHQSRIAAAQEVGLARIVLDKLGRVHYCNAAAVRLFCANTRQLPGRDIRSLVPDLPFRPATPGYNLAYAIFWAAEGAWRRFTGRDSLGRSFRLQAWLDKAQLESRQQILLSLRPALGLAHPQRRSADGPMIARRAAACIAWCDPVSQIN